MPKPARGGEFTIFIAGAYAADKRRWADHTSAIAHLRDEVSQAQSAGDSTQASAIEGEIEALEAYGLWRRGRKEEAAEALEDAAHRATGHGPWGGVNDIVRWWLGTLYLEMGRLPDAERAFRSFYPEPLASYRLGRIYEELGDFAKARDSYELFAVGWQDADSELQPMVEEARAAVRRLTSVVQE